MAVTTITRVGSFDNQLATQINDNFSAVGSGGSFASPAITGTVTGGASYTAPTLTSPTITGTTTIGTGATLTAPTFTTPALGTPASGVLTSCTGLPISTGVTGLGTGVATALAVNVGSAGAPVVLNGALGTPSSGTLTSCTGLPIAGITGLGTNIATGLAATGVTAGPFTTVSSLRTIGGIVTVLTGS